MSLEEITKNKEVQGRLKEENSPNNLESKINSKYNSTEKKFSKAGESTTIAAKLYNGFVNAPAGIFNGGHNTLKNSYKFIVSEDYRSEKVKNYISGRIYKAEQKGRISTARADYLYGHLDKEKISPYLFDFFMHTVGLNLAGFSLGCYFVYMPLFSGNAGFLESVARAGITGSITRTAWTTGRITYDCLRKLSEERQDKTPLKEIIKSSFKERSVAFWEELWPFWGVTAYPKQMYCSECEISKEFGEFLINDIRNSIESKVPPLKYVRIGLNNAYRFSKSFINNTKKDIEFYFDKIYKGPLHINNYGTNKNNRDKRIK